MKKTYVIFTGVLVAILFLAGFLFKQDAQSYPEYLRIHIRANSNEDCDQNVKYEIKDKIVEILTPIVANCNTKEEAENMINQNIKRIEAAADAVLKEKGFDYVAKAKIKNEEFPTRVYNEYTLYQGYYDALIVELGKAEGNNWWCVVYPPLCFTSAKTNYVYKSKIAEIIRNFFE